MQLMAALRDEHGNDAGQTHGSEEHSAERKNADKDRADGDFAVSPRTQQHGFR